MCYFIKQIEIINEIYVNATQKITTESTEKLVTTSTF